ncbi:hypothetical protein PG2029B_1428 [Bifidobacterium pseudolongum subsp. globosum]|uniref:Uncharacterized protein n=1 Tax=Bifidobacterium pseudolongum subsp. globosum TaxID=1690 RepID=A0A4Q5ADA6_9BIFI|nr:hypothetical protein PG2032B_1427 [Bifidobacterium pseudolongum subsp. globosum]RYQ26748.1 hypothetical protein PG2029B_1428 [Bifidobacterium pseudolongum subsp. globosum]
MTRHWTDHPRTCGANLQCTYLKTHVNGSSPHMRGKRFLPSTTPPPLRIIPAHAGQTVLARVWGRAGSDHPRTCGANSSRVMRLWPLSGSSPHMRGKLSEHRMWVIDTRIIPAHAGQTYLYGGRDHAKPDHPRTCGANSMFSTGTVYWVGSSPHMRGKPAEPLQQGVEHRIIPAHAGQTRDIAWRAGRTPDHPRTCGANYFASGNFFGRYGSSPHMRGKLRADCSARAPRWIIPAHAGQTMRNRSSRPLPADHPRTCGANAPNTVFLMPRTGSSPHMRGKLSDSRPPPQSPRIIPAHAGQTSNPRRKSWKPTDHPRICGANVDSAVQSNPPDGSSPHMRGKPFRPVAFPPRIRIIPAHAGQTPFPSPKA